MKKMRIFEILRELGAFEVKQPANLEGSKTSKVLKGLFSEQKNPDGVREFIRKWPLEFGSCGGLPKKLEHPIHPAYFSLSPGEQNLIGPDQASPDEKG